MENENMDKEELKEEIKTGEEDLKEEKIHERVEEVKEEIEVKNNGGWKKINQSENFILMKRRLMGKNDILNLMEEMRKNNFVFRGMVFDIYVVFEKNGLNKYE